MINVAFLWQPQAGSSSLTSHQPLCFAVTPRPRPSAGPIPSLHACLLREPNTRHRCFLPFPAKPNTRGCLWLSLSSVARAGASAGRLARPLPNGAASRSSRRGGARSLVGVSRPALANILIGDATDPVCESVFRSRGHAVDFKPGLSKVRGIESLCVAVGWKENGRGIKMQ